MINCSCSKVNVPVGEEGRVSNFVSKCDSSDVAKALIDFVAVLDSIQKHSSENQDKLPAVLSQTIICTVLMITQLLLMIPCGMVSKLSDLTKTVGTLRSER